MDIWDERPEAVYEALEDLETEESYMGRNEVKYGACKRTFTIQDRKNP